MTDVNIDDVPDEDSHQVLDIYHRKNKPIKPPPSSSSVPGNRFPVPADHSHVSADCSRVPANRSQFPANRSQFPANHSQVPVDRSNASANRSNAPVDHSRVPANRSQVPASRSQVPASRSQVPANRSQAPVDRSNASANRSNAPANHSLVSAHPQVPANRSQFPANPQADPADVDDVGSYQEPCGHVTDPVEDEDENASDNCGKKPRATRNSKSHSDPKPSQFGYYSGPWADVLIIARNNYRKFIHTNNPFPERNSSNLQDANNSLLEAIAEYQEENNDLDKSLFFLYLC